MKVNKTAIATAVITAVLLTGGAAFANQGDPEPAQTPEAVVAEEPTTEPTAPQPTEEAPAPTPEPVKQQTKGRGFSPNPTSATSDPVNTPTTGESAPDAPPPVPVIDPYTIVSVEITDPQPTDKNPDPLRTCRYNLYDGTSQVVMQYRTKACQPVGDIFYAYN